MDQRPIDLIKSICEEFCDCVLVDSSMGSFLVYIKKRYYQPLSSRLGQLEVLEIFKNERNNRFVVLYQAMELVDDIVQFEDDDYEDDDLDW
jgi:hypothetical protein